MKKGFTLPELLITVGIFSILITVLGNVFANIVEARLKGEAQAAVAREASYLVTRFGYDVGRATAITLPSVNQSGSQLNLTIAGTTYDYKLDNGKLLFGTVGTEKEVTGSEVRITDFSVTRMQDMSSRGSAKISITISTNDTIPGAQVIERTIGMTYATR